MNVTVDLQNASGVRKLPLKRQFAQWASLALADMPATAERTHLSIRIVDESESAELNERYRNKQGSTNILSFPVPPALIAAGTLGDLAICAQVVDREAREQGKSAPAHWAHLVIHGVLHLQGYDHESAPDAARMEALEVSILDKLDIANPYQ
ncbi:MAG TPA: rRNA maturation RNase YbeY [Pseudomonadaceae bacterium]|nr:rRNA maturation RNase YbeY [Pseudomonadaceae bacterium]